MGRALEGKRIVVPEMRELDLFTCMLEQHGATTIRCPMITIDDAPDATPVEAWLRRFINEAPDGVILMTGEGVRRLIGFASRACLKEAFISTLDRVCKITRGPKPVRQLRECGLDADQAAEPPTTKGIIRTLSHQDLSRRRIAIQLYPDNPCIELIDFLSAAGARADPVLCYVYGTASDDRRVMTVIQEMAGGRVDLVAFTSSPQVRRMQHVAEQNKCEDILLQAFQRTKIAAVGPIVARAIEDAGGRVSIVPSKNFHLKPLVNEIITAFK